VRPALGPTQSPKERVPGAFSLGIKRPGREADHSPPSSAEVKNAWSYTPTLQYAFMAWCLIKKMNRDVFFSTWNERKMGVGGLSLLVCLSFLLICCICETIERFSIKFSIGRCKRISVGHI
jgi:hypothetical protein